MNFENQPMTENEFFKTERKKKGKNQKLCLIGNSLAFVGAMANIFILSSIHLGFDLIENERWKISLCFYIVAGVGFVLNFAGIIKMKKEYEKYLENYSAKNQEEKQN